MTTVALAQQPMAFFHQDGVVAAWTFAKRYAGKGGRIATLPDIVAARLKGTLDANIWSAYFTTSTAEYYGIGADGRPKLIVAHGVGPMSTLDGIKKAYAWEYRDRQRRRSGGRISAEEFLKLEAGQYGNTATVSGTGLFFTPSTFQHVVVFVIDMLEYMDTWGENVFYRRHKSPMAKADLLLLARLGHDAMRYIDLHHCFTSKWCKERHFGSDRAYPYILFNEGAANCPYLTYPKVGGRLDWKNPIPRPLEEGMAMGHLISTDAPHDTVSNDDEGRWESLISEVRCFEWWNGVRFVGMPEGASADQDLVFAPGPEEVLKARWRELMQPVEDDFTPPPLFRIEQTDEDDEWFTRYPKLPKGERRDDSDIEFHVRSVEPIGELAQFVVEDDLFLRYNLAAVIAVAPQGANAYEIVDWSRPDSDGRTIVNVQFYVADVDTSQRIPRVKDIKQNYTLLMG